jgi:hypothetical protein
MAIVSAVCFFCEDIREEQRGQSTIVGTLPDNLQAEGKPPPSSSKAKPMMPKLGIYLRINLSADADIPKEVSARVVDPNGEIIAESEWAPGILEKAFADSRANNLPLVGLIFKAVMAPLALSGGRISTIATVDGTDHLAGAINIILPSVSPPPA